jgi:hypothetical protein
MGFLPERPGSQRAGGGGGGGGGAFTIDSFFDVFCDFDLDRR